MSTQTSTTVIIERSDEQVDAMKLLLWFDSHRAQPLSPKNPIFRVLATGTGLSDDDLQDLLVRPEAESVTPRQHLDLQDLGRRIRLEISLESSIAAMKEQVTSMVDHLRQLEADLERLRRY